MHTDIRTTILIGLIVAAALSPRLLRHLGGRRDAVPEKLYNGPEALEWLKTSKSESAFASNRFGPTGNAIAFVESLYEAGALRVMISSECIMDEPERIEEEGGPYADGLVVVFPESTERRSKLLEICKREAASEGFGVDLGRDLRDGKLFLWWD